MSDKPSTPKPDRDDPPTNISIGGNVGPGSAIGPNASVKALNIAGRDLSTNSEEINTKTVEDFQGMLGDLRKLIEEAQKAGEIDDAAAKTALENVETAEKLAREDPPPKKKLLRKLQEVAELIDGAREALEATGVVAHVILKAAPITALLLKIANILF